MTPIFFSTESQSPAAQMIADLLSETGLGMKVRSLDRYTDALTSISIIPICVDEEHLQRLALKERRYISWKRKEADYRLFIPFLPFIHASAEERAAMCRDVIRASLADIRARCAEKQLRFDLDLLLRDVFPDRKGPSRYCWLFHVQHRYVVAGSQDDPAYETKLIGIFSSAERAREAMLQHSSLPGFSSHPDGFSITRRRCSLNAVKRRDQLSRVYMPCRQQELPDEDCDRITTGGLYDNRDDALQVINTWKQKDRQTEGGRITYEIAVSRIDVSEWDEGFTPW